MQRCSYYECQTCLKPFFGGLIDCETETNNEESKADQEIHCMTCLLKKIGFGQKTCSVHNEEQAIVWKCMYCCSEVAYMCNMGTLHLCKTCKGKSEYQR